ncbi:hypothetical protein LMG19282_01455 [Cupriavidus campinensis]|uniref:Uncharacterized protein n=1 Tax=Cupriavidus campinensis TaxID=151783 RepID=A0ABY3EJA3_9BURK|nr:hypothetical protein [Cupriavidus campinensis]TSP11019.1 hypothetical protein FGG12_19345 [Cupriavidus campinensis]CAG2138167.1 hypothetical protein LMG19282_01455 [Cupriavidus campinensis]
MTIYVKHDGLWALSPEQEQAALRAGCVGLNFGDSFKPLLGNVFLARSTNDWVGVYRFNANSQWPVRIKRFQDFDRALRFAQREDRA